MTPKRRESWIRFEASAPGVEWAAAHFAGIAFAPHRHDTYAIGVTTAGVQAFDYRGEARRACPGDAFVLHPDELHDGRPGTADGYGYRIVYVAPDLIGAALGGGALPFVADAVSRDAGLTSAIRRAFPHPSEPPDELLRNDAVTALADALRQACDRSIPDEPNLGVAAMAGVREHLRASVEAGVSMAELEREHGIDRYTLSRAFRRAYGVSPHRFLILRRLDRVKDDIRRGTNLADAALAAGFCDQAHMSRHFRGAFGMPPGKWRALLQ